MSLNPLSFRPSPWLFVTSEGAEFDALVAAAGKGSFYVKNSDDPDGIVHELLYVGWGVGKSKGPLPFGLGGSFSTADMESGGFGPIRRHSRKAQLTADDFGGYGVILSGAYGIVKGLSIGMVLFGLPAFPKAIGFTFSDEYIAPGVGATIMNAWFTVDP